MPCGSKVALAAVRAAANKVGPLAIVPRPMVAPDRMMVGDRAAVRDHAHPGGRFDGVATADQLAMPPSAWNVKYGAGPSG